MSVLMAADASCSACDVDSVTDKYRLASPLRDVLAALRCSDVTFDVLAKFLQGNGGVF